MTRRSRRILLAGALALATLVLLVAAAFLLLQTRPVKNALATFAAEAASSEAMTITIEGLGGFLPFTLAVDRVTLASPEGTWLEAEALALDWSPLALLSGTIRVETLELGRLRLSSLPPSAPDQAPEPQPGPVWPPEELALPRLDLRKLHVERIELDEPVLGQAAVFTLAGDARAEGADLDAALDLVRTDSGTASPARLRLNAILTDSWPDKQLQLDIEVHEPPEGLLAAATGLKQRAPLDFILRGKGLVQDWNGTMALQTGDETLLDGGIGIRVRNPDGDPDRLDLALAVDAALFPRTAVGRADAPGLLHALLGAQERAAAWELGERVSLQQKATLRLADGEVVGLDLDQLDMTAETLTLKASARLGRTLEDLDAEAVVRVADLAILGTFLPGTPTGAAAMDLTVRRAGEGLDGRANLTLANAAYDDYAADNATLAVRLTPQPRVDDQPAPQEAGPLPAGALALDLTTTGLALPEGLGSVAAAVGDAPFLRAELATTAPDAIVIQSLELIGQRARLNLAGNVSLQGPATLDATLALDELAPPARELGLALEGAAELEIDADGDWSAPAGRVAFSLLTRNLAVGAVDAPPATAAAGRTPGQLEQVGALMGETPAMTGEVVLHEDGRLVVERLATDAKAFALNAAGEASLTDPDAPLTLDAQLAVPRLDALAPLVNADLGGAVEASITAEGSMAEPRLQADLAVTRPAFAGQTYDRLEVALTAQGPAEALSGDLRVDLAGVRAASPAPPAAADSATPPPTASLGLQTAYALQEGVLALRSLALEGPGLRLGGELSANLDTTLMTGRLEGGSADLAALGDFLGQELAGSARLTIAMSTPAEGGQAADITLDARQVAAGGLRLETVAAQAQLVDLLGTPAGDAEITLTGLETDGFSASRIGMNVIQRAEGLDFEGAVTARLAAAQPIPLDLDFTGTLQPPAGPDDALALTLRSLEGEFGGEVLRLNSASELRAQGDALAIDGFALAWAGGTLTMEGGWGPARPDGVNLEAAIRDLPLDAPLAMAGAADTLAPGAVLQATLQLAGSAAAPRVALNLEVRDIAMRTDPESPLQELDPMTVIAEATIEGGELALQVDVDGLPDDGDLTVTANAPARLSLAPFAFSQPENAALDGAVTADLDLAGFQPILTYYQIEAAGELRADFTLQGTLQAPELSGKTALRNASIKAAQSGTSLTEMTLEAAAAEHEGRPRVLLTLEAQDGYDGKLTLSGWLDVDPATNYPMTVKAAMANFAATRSDDLIVVVSGEIGLEGDLEDSRVLGGLTLNPVRAYLPSQLPPSVAEVEVVDIRTGRPHGAPAPEADGEDQPRANATAALKATGFNPRLEVGVEIPEGAMRVQGLGVDSTWKGRLDAEGSLASPKLVGNVDVTRGDIEFLGKRFDIRKGGLNFWGRQPPTPRVDVQAVTEAGEVLAIINVAGLASKPRITLASEPSRPRDEILAYILFGRRLDRINAVQALKLAQTASLLTGDDFLSIQRNAQQVPGLGGLDLDLRDEEGGGVFALGQDLTEGVRVNVEEGVGESETQVEVEVDITNQLMLQGTMDDRGEQGVGLDWSMDY